jgi:pentatricopeptide repeat protein
MVFRSCLCSRNKCPASTLYKLMPTTSTPTKSLKYPGILLHYPRQSLLRHLSTATSVTTKESTSIPIPIIDHVDPKPPADTLPDNQSLDRVLHHYTKKQCKAFYRRLAKASPEVIAKMFVSQLDTIDYFKQLRRVFLDAGAYWSVETIQGVIKALGFKHSKLQFDLLTQLLLPKYVLDRDISALIHALPEKGDPYYLMPFYNAVLSRCQRCKELDHVRLMLTIMKERDITFDTATFNILIKMKLTGGLENDITTTTTLYQSLLDEGFKPNQATFNTFIKHAVSREDWDGLNVWLDKMEKNEIVPSAITIRILFRAFVRYPSEPQLTRAFDRVTASIPVAKREKFLNTGATGLLEADDPRSALDLIAKAIEYNEPVSAYCYNLYLKSLCMQGKLEKAQSVLESMILSNNSNIPNPDIVSFTTVINGLVRHNEYEQAQALYDQINERGLHANNVLHTVMLHNLIKSPQHNLNQVQSLFHSIISNKNVPQLPQQRADIALNEINIYNMMMDFYFLHYHKSKQLRHQIPPQPFALLKDMVNKKQLKPTVATLNIMVKGLAILNKDLNAAEKMVTLMKAQGVEMDEKTVWYLTKSAYKQGQSNRARHWIEVYERQNKPIKGSGLLQLKSVLTKYTKQAAIVVE